MANTSYHIPAEPSIVFSTAVTLDSRTRTVHMHSITPAETTDAFSTASTLDSRTRTVYTCTLVDESSSITL